MSKKNTDKRKIRAFSMLSMKRGTPKKDLVERKSSCSKCGLLLNSGTECLAFPHSKGFTNYHRLCKDCAMKILDKSKKDLDEVERLIREVYKT